VLFGIALAMTFGTGAGQAGGSLAVSLSPLIGTGSNQVPQVTNGGKLALHLSVSNPGNATANHLLMVVDTDNATFSNASRPECGADPNDSSRMVCTLKQMKHGGSFSVDVRFTVAASGTSVTAVPSVTINAQTRGNPGNNGSGTSGGAPVTATLVGPAGGSLVKTFLAATESAATNLALTQHSAFTLPSALLGGTFGVALSVQETTQAAPCTHCPTAVTDLQIPASLGPGSPFSATNPFSFTVSLLPSGQPWGYVPTGLYHDGVLVPLCSLHPLGPTTHICLTSAPVLTLGSTFVATGIADQNGKIGFG
jgi:hypothetical protein